MAELTETPWGPATVSTRTAPPAGTPLLGGAVPSPVMALRGSALRHNIDTMAQYCRDHGVALAPHGKTTMSPQLFRAQLDAGCWGITAATGAHVRTYRQFGVSRIFLGNALVDPAAIRYIAAELAADRSFEFVCYVDSVAGVELLDRELADSAADGLPMDVVVELGVPGGRTGCRTIAEALAVAGAADSSSRLRLIGLAGYEGAIGADRSPATLTAMRSYCADLRELAEQLEAAGLLSQERAPLLSAGGSMFYDAVVEALAGATIGDRSAQVLLRSGAYVSHDEGIYQRVSPFEQPGSQYRFQPALRLWGRVLSRPEPGLAVVDFGRRDAPYDQDLPVPVETRSADGSDPQPAADLTVTALNDQHAFVRLPDSRELPVGSWLGCGVSHPCTTFDKWRYMPVVDEENVVVGGIDTYF
ncbi:amino acid deaminase [Ornithinicoccus halotolerans]|uniref:amino acid deaminase n=1 Tax=Ornithinicoccus halotolerans TaxID=1748220 RepID=UPI001297E744|nr:amino acid deaminase [Ornithinicoccus halotolerans]